MFGRSMNTVQTSPEVIAQELFKKVNGVSRELSNHISLTGKTLHRHLFERYT